MKKILSKLRSNKLKEVSKNSNYRIVAFNSVLGLQNIIERHSDDDDDRSD